MCLRPVTIRNPKYKNGYFLKSVDKEFVSVPCGHCSECAHKKQNDLVVRGYYEWLDCVANGGFALFDTLTFSDINIPQYNGWRYFDKSVFQLFFKRLESNLERQGYDIRGNLKHILTTEYGSLTFRAHAHLLHFSKVPGLTPQKLNEEVVKAWKNVDTGEKIGINDSKAVEDRVINSVYGIRYVCKYISKDTSVLDAIKYHKDTELSRFIIEYFTNTLNVNFFNIQYNEVDKYFPVIRQLFLSYKITHDCPQEFELFNFTMISHGLGLYFLRHATIDDLLNDIVIQDQSDRQYNVYSVPSYYLRKKFYNYNKYSKRYIPNEYYDLLRATNDKRMLDGLTANERTLEDIFNSLSDKRKSCIFKKCGIDKDVPFPCTAFRDRINELLNGRSLEHFYKYVIYFRGVHVSPYLEWLYEGNLETLDDAFIDLYTEYRNDALKRDSLVYRTDLGINLMPEVCEIDHFSPDILFNQLPYFDNYDIIYDMIRTVLFHYKQALNIQYKRKQEEIEKYHATLKKSMNNSIIFN